MGEQESRQLGGFLGTPAEAGDLQHLLVELWSLKWCLSLVVFSIKYVIFNTITGIPAFMVVAMRPR